MCKFMQISFTLASFFHMIRTITIDNGVIGTPKIECGLDSIIVNVTTRNPFLGRIFVKGKSHLADCSKKFVNNTDLTTNGQLEVKFSTCGMQRQRKLSPVPLMEETVNVVVSFHYLFITKVDKSYSIQCQYGAQTSANVMYNFNVSMIPSESLTVGGGPTPECSYEIRKGSINGPLVQYAEVGDQLFHRWMCFGDIKILIRNCYVTDGNAEKFAVIDTRGCAIDYNVLGDVNYDTSGQSAYVESHAFKFADTTSIAFACTIKVCSPSKENCAETTPPQCTPLALALLAQTHVKQRDAPFVSTSDDEIDVSAPAFNVLDHQLNNNVELNDENEFSGAKSNSNSKYRSRHISIPANVCLSKIFIIALIVSVFGTVIPLAVGIAILVTVFRRQKKSCQIYS